MKIKKISLLVLGAVLLVGCGNNANPSSEVVSEDSSVTSVDASTETSVEEVSVDSSVEETLTIETSGTYTNENNVITLLTAETSYAFSGTYEGTIIAPETVTKVTVTFNGFSLDSREYGKAISYTASSSKLVLNLVGDENYIYSTKTAVSSENNVEVTGEGTLNIDTDKHGFNVSNFTIEDGNDVTLKINAGENGIDAKQVIVESGEIQAIVDTGYGIYAEQNSKGNKGTIAFSQDAKFVSKDSSFALAGQTSITFTDTASIELTSAKNELAIMTPTFDFANTCSFTVNNIATDYTTYVNNTWNV